MIEDIKRNPNECAIDYFKRIVPCLNEMNDKQKVNALSLIWDDAYWTGHGNAREELGEKPLISMSKLKYHE